MLRRLRRGRRLRFRFWLTLLFLRGNLGLLCLELGRQLRLRGDFLLNCHWPAPPICLSHNSLLPRGECLLVFLERRILPFSQVGELPNKLRVVCLEPVLHLLVLAQHDRVYCLLLFLARFFCCTGSWFGGPIGQFGLHHVVQAHVAPAKKHQSHLEPVRLAPSAFVSLYKLKNFRLDVHQQGEPLNVTLAFKHQSSPVADFGVVDVFEFEDQD